MADFFTFFKMVSFFFFLIAELTLAQTFEEEKILPNGPIGSDEPKEADSAQSDLSIPGIYEQLFHKYDPLNTSFISHHNYFDLLVDILVTAGHEDGQSLTKRENELMRLALERFVNEKKGDKFSYEEVVEDIDSKKMVQFVNEAFLEHFNEEYEGEEDEILEEEGDNKENIEKERKEKTNENTNEDGNKDDYQMKNNKEKEDHNKNNEEKIDENAGVEENINENVNKNKEKLEL